MAPTVVFTGGGTGGHIYPGLAVVDRLKALLAEEGKAIRVVWMGSTKESDRTLVETAGIEYRPLPSGKLRRELSLKNFADVFRVLGGFLASRRILKQLKPLLVFSKGGYVSVPPCRAAASLGIPVYTHESDLSPGLATRLNARVAQRIFVSYDETRERFSAPLRDRVEVSGQPVRAALLGGDASRGRAFAGMPPDLPLILVIGGSQGARRLNELLAGALPELLKTAVVVHQTGPGNSGCPSESLPSGLRKRYCAFEYIRGELPDLYAAASLYVGRAGAGSLWECASVGLPMVLVPLAGSGTRGDQVENARWFAGQGAALVLEGDDAQDSGALALAVTGLLGNPAQLASMARAAGKLGERNAADFLAREIASRIPSGGKP